MKEECLESEMKGECLERDKWRMFKRDRKRYQPPLEPIIKKIDSIYALSARYANVGKSNKIFSINSRAYKKSE